MPCLIDTNVLIHALAGDAGVQALSRIDDAIADKARYSVVTRMELLGWSGHTTDTRRDHRRQRAGKTCCQRRAETACIWPV